MSLIHLFTLGFRENYLIPGLIIGIIMASYAFIRLSYLFSYYGISKRNSLILRSISSIFIIICSANVQSTVTLLIAYLFGCSLLVDIIGIAYKLISKKGLKIHKNGILAIILFIIVIAYSAYGLSTVSETDYNITTDKTNESYTILYISDIHYDTIQDPNILVNKISEMNAVHPDFIVLGGDVTDEGTSRESMIKVFEELGTLNSTYGTYFIYGNHDRQPKVGDYREGTKPYSNDELVSVIKENNITILEDDSVVINNDIVLVGRKDAGHGNDIKRAAISDLVNNLSVSKNSGKFVLVLDHQPLDEGNVSKVADLMISGHTHGGQIFPYGLVTNLSGKPNYGLYSYGTMKEIVSSGFCGWGIPLRNECPCEYVVVKVN